MKKVVLILVLGLAGIVSNAQIIKSSAFYVTRTEVQKEKKPSNVKYWGTVEFATTFNGMDYFVGAQTIHGIKLRERFCIGVGLGMGGYQDTFSDYTYDESGFAMPIFAHLSYELLNKSKCSPYIAANLGFLLFESAILNPSIGLRFKLPKGGLRIGVGIDGWFMFDSPAATLNLAYAFH